MFILKTDININYKKYRKLGEELKKRISKLDENQDKEIVFFFIGTDRSTGDCYAPLVGTFCNKMRKVNERVVFVGSLENPVHAQNLNSSVEMIRENYKNSIVIAVDACLSKEENLSQIIISNTPIKPGVALNKKLTEIGDISIKGIVNVDSDYPFVVLQNTNLSRVYSMAEYTAKAIRYAIKDLI